MTAPPILEIYVVWHPDDEWGAEVADGLLRHFHGPAYSGLAGGAAEVYFRSSSWDSVGSPPRPLPFMEELPAGLQPAQITVTIPILGRGLARAVRSDAAWAEYVRAIVSESESGTVLPVRSPGAQIDNGQLNDAIGHLQTISGGSGTDVIPEIAQAIAQYLTGASDGQGNRVTVFISHTKRPGGQSDNAGEIVDTIRDIIRSSHLGAFFDSSEIQPADDWAQVIRNSASRNAMLMVRTDRYSSREWTQREVLLAKEHDLPVVSLHALRGEELRGSFLMDHVPTVACPPGKEREAATIALNRLVDEALKRALWNVQRVYLEADGFDWLPVHAPEPVTLTAWLREHSGDMKPPIIVMHPDPPLGPPELESLQQLGNLVEGLGEIQVHTPRTFASRGGRLR